MVKLEFDSNFYSIEAIQKACYRYINLFAPNLSLKDGVITCELSPNKDLSLDSIQHHLNELQREALDQQLRVKIRTETEPVRNLILGIAFSKTSLLSGE